MPLTKPYEAYERPGIVVAYKISNVKIFKGAAVGLNASGHAVPLTPATANLKYIGVAGETVDNSAGTAGGKSINVTKTGSFVFKANGFTPAATDLGLIAYAVSDWEALNATSGLANAYALGSIVAQESTSTAETGVRIRIDRHTL